MEKELKNYPINDLPLLYSVIKTLGIAGAINNQFKTHGNWVGILPGEILELWLCYILSQCDHRLSGAEEWAKKHLEFLRIMSGLSKLSIHDFSDDKLGSLLGYFSEDKVWGVVEKKVNQNGLGVYRLKEE